MKPYLRPLLFIAIFILSCDSDDFDGDSNSFMIEVGDNALFTEEGSNNYLVVHSAEGSVLASSQLSNGELLNIDLSDFSDDFVSVSLIRRIEFGDFVTNTVNTFLEVDVTETFKITDLDNEYPSSDTQTDIVMENLTENIASIRLARPGFFSVADPSFFNNVPSFSYRFAVDKPEIFVTAQLIEGIFKYAPVTLIPDESITIDPNNGITMINTLTSVPNQNLDYSVSLSGINRNDGRFDSYSMYSGFELQSENSALNIPTPLSDTFDELETFIRGVDSNTIYDQGTKGVSTPVSFTQLGADISINNIDFANIDFTVTGEYNIVYSAWENDDKSLIWHIYGPGGQANGFQIPDLSDNNVFAEVVDRVGDLNLSFITVGQLDDLTYSNLLNESSIVKSHRFFLRNQSIRSTLTKSIVY